MSSTHQHMDVVIIGAGLSGIGAAAHLTTELPYKRYAVLEARSAIGGTWDLFRYPGIRSDSDMYTFGYRFKPWTGRTLADGPSIQRYIEDTADEYGVRGHIRFHHRVLAAEWSSSTARWTITAQRTDTDQLVTFTASWVIGATGYYDVNNGYRPQLPSEEHFRGPIVHPQHWPDDLDYSGQRVVVIGSGATAVTLVPSLAKKAAQVTMLQRTPTYIASVPAEDPLVRVLRKVLPSQNAARVLRWKYILLRQAQYSISRALPKIVRAKIRHDINKQLPDDYDVDTHFNPPYDPWDQRICAVPDGDLFDALGTDKASIKTDTIRTFTREGIELDSGEFLPADLVITATGLNLQWLGGMTVTVDGQEVALRDRFVYKGMMLSGVPNLNLVSGYTNNSWTLKADLVNRYVCHLLHHMDEQHYDAVTPMTPIGHKPSPAMELDAGYVRRGLGSMPKQGSRVPWRLHQNYLKDLRLFNPRNLDDGHVRFRRIGEIKQSNPHRPPGITVPTQTITVDGRQVRYRDEGHGVPVVFVHGIARSLEDWDEQHELLRGQGFRLISVDLPGYGGSAPLDAPHSLTALAQGFNAFLDAMELTEPAHLVGNSLGGAVVMQLAAQAPSRVRSLTLVNSAGFGREVTIPLRPLGQLLTRRPSLASARRVEESLFHDPVHVTEKRINLGYRLASRPHGTRVFFETARSLSTISGIRPAWRKELLETLATHHIPTFVVWGATDTIFPAAHLTTAGQYFPHAKTHCSPNTGHMPQIERSQEFARLLIQFWSESSDDSDAARSIRLAARRRRR